MTKAIVTATGPEPFQLLGGDDLFAFENKMILYTFKITLKKMLNKYSQVVCVSGMGAGVDLIFAMACIELRESYGDRIQLICASPYERYQEGWSETHKLIAKVIVANSQIQVNTSNQTYATLATKPQLLWGHSKWLVDNATHVWVLWDKKDKELQKIITYSKKQNKKLDVWSVGLKGRGHEKD